MAKYDEYSQIEHEDEFGSSWGDDFSQLQEEIGGEGSDGDYVVVKDEFSQVPVRGHSSQAVSPKAELARALREIAKGEPSTRQKNAPAPTPSKTTIGSTGVKSEAKKHPVAKEDQLSLQLQSEGSSLSLGDDPFGLGDVGLIDITNLRNIGGEGATSPEFVDTAIATGDATPAVEAADAVIATGDATPAVEAADAVIATGDATPAVEAADAVIATGDATPAVEAADAVIATGDATPAVEAADTAIATGDATPAVEVSDAVINAGDTQPAVGDNNGVEGAATATAPVKRKRRVRVQPDNCKRRYDKEAKRIRLDKIRECVLTHFSQKQFCLQDIKDILKLDIEQWEKDGVLGFDTELSVCVKGMGVEVIGQVQRMNGKRGRPSNIMVLTGKVE
ncbi:hypothetical protein JE959_000156 [Aeromonas veronii]|nr:hypothetical protein [Aeromonas veronii]